MTSCLGRQPARRDPRTLRLARYIAPEVLANVPPMFNWGTAVRDWGMMRNDELGDCTAASVAHIILAHTAWTQPAAPVRLTDDQVVDLYSATSGYRPSNPATDRGAVELDVLNYWRQEGVAGHKINAYAAVSLDNPLLLRAAIWLFGAVYAGVDLPLRAQDQTGPWFLDDWKLTGQAKPGSWGGHAVPLIGYDTRAFNCITWGQPQWMTEDWWLAYGSEAYAVVSPDWAPPAGVAPNHLNINQLMADLAIVTKE